jgi:hypothetical protein
MANWTVEIYADYAPEALSASPNTITHTHLIIVSGSTTVVDQTYDSQQEALDAIGTLADGTYTVTLQTEDSSNNPVGTPLVRTLVLPSSNFSPSPSAIRFSVRPA